MSDIRLKFDPLDLKFDLGIVKNDLETDDGLETAVIISLFCDRRITDKELPPGETDKRGWWGDAVDPENQDLIGSKLWLLFREKQTQESLDRAKEYCEEALQWLLDDGIASAVDVETSYPEAGRIVIAAVITKPEGNEVKYKYNLIWEGQSNAIH